MHTRLVKAGGILACGAAAIGCAWLGLMAFGSAINARAGAGADAPNPLVWDEQLKESWPKPGQQVAEFKFTVTNTSPYDTATINSVTTSCGCTVAKIPSQPWLITGGSNGDMTISVNLAAKTGTFTKTITVNTQGFGPEILTVKVHMPDSPEAMRQTNLQLAMADRQAPLKGDCAKCHADPAAGKTSKELYVAVCSVCHDAPDRATMVTDLKNIKHPTDYDFWKTMITVGKPGTLMPGFGTNAGGPLTAEQIDSLAKALVTMYPSHPTNAAAPEPQIINRVGPN